LGDKCPKCGEKNWFKQADAGKTFFGNKLKIKCGNCGKIFAVNRPPV
jgi:rRNA maturation protein Nop10